MKLNQFPIAQFKRIVSVFQDIFICRLAYAVIINPPDIIAKLYSKFKKNLMPVTIEKIFIKTDNNANEIPDLLKPCMNKIYQNLDCIEPYETKYGCDADKFEVF